MLRTTNLMGICLCFGAALAIFSFCGCPSANRKETGGQSTGPNEKAPSSTSPAERQSQEETANPQESGEGTAPESLPPYNREIPANLGKPLVDSPDDLKRLELDSPVWIDNKSKQVVLIGSVCRADYPLEFFATYPDRSYESVVVIYTKPSVVHAALLALGAKSGKPVQYNPNFVPPTGAEVVIEVAWLDQKGKRQKAKAQDWIRDIKTKKPLDVNWVFAGSMFWEDKSTGAKSYLADRGDFISVLNLPTALLDVPIESASALESRLYEGFVERLPAPGTPVTLILTPKLD